MDLEARSLQPSVKAMLLAKLREYKSDLTKLKREVKKLASAKSSLTAHEELLESGMVKSPFPNYWNWNCLFPYTKSGIANSHYRLLQIKEID